MSTEGSQIAAAETAQHTPRRIDEFLRDVLAKGGSDLHFVAGDPPRIRLHGDLQTLRDAPLTQEQVREAMNEIMTRQAVARLEEKDGADFAYTIPGVSRFRVNVFRHIAGLGGVLALRGTISAGDLAIAVLYLNQMLKPVEKINDAFDLMHEGTSIRSVVTS